MSNINISAILKDSTDLTIVPKNWKFMEMGEGHIILENSNENDPLFDKVLSICRHQIGSFPLAFDHIYERVINCSQQIKQCLLQREQMVFLQDQLTKFKKMLQRILDAPIENCKVFLAQNLARSRNLWDYYMQFKPKTILPDFYSTNFLNEYCIKHKINFENLIKILQTSPYIQKIRWFKKNALKQKKKNMNPFQIFSYATSTQPNYLKLVRLINHQNNTINIGKQTQKLKINNQQIAKIIQDTNILSNILKLQLLFTESHDFNEINVHELWDQQNDKQVKMKTILSSILSNVAQSSILWEQVSSLFRQAPYIINKHSYNCQLQKIIRFLISWSWKDISIIVRFKVDALGQKIIESDLKIIDYELKQTSKLIQTIKKDQQFLSQYLLFKKIN